MDCKSITIISITVTREFHSKIYSACSRKYFRSRKLSVQVTLFYCTKRHRRGLVPYFNVMTICDLLIDKRLVQIVLSQPTK